ncbi:hypothetical protein [Streptomyces viridochromogenes]|uniref:hypothetical protein n=1 Tax=Streptomyces viridochromogenes TaxID=1938 RepID=UPI001AD81AD0|nr:hypothetical protein [Streptomyces viridochromogenes]
MSNTTTAGVQPYPPGTRWIFRSKNGYVHTEELALSWLVGRAGPICEDPSAEGQPADVLWRYWAKDANHYHERWPEAFRPGEVHISWRVVSPTPDSGVFEGAPYTRDPRHLPRQSQVDEEQDDFLAHYSFPTHAVSGERLNWLRLPVLDRAWREDREDVGGFVQEASGWKPSPLQLAMDVVQVARCSGLWTPELALMSGDLDDGEQYELGNWLAEHREDMDSDVFDALYAKLGKHHQRDLDASISDWADSAVGDASWRG